MSNEFHKILPGDEFPKEERIKKYLSHQMTEAEKHAFEMEMLNDPLLEEAVEGLEALPPDHISTAVQSINLGFKKTIERKKRKGRYAGVGDQSITIVAIILIILLCVIGYILIRKFA